MIIRGSYGDLTVHEASGLVLERDLDGPEYEDIAWFDPARLPKGTCGECDILDTAFVTVEGVYVRELIYPDTGEAWVDQLFLEGPKS